MISKVIKNLSIAILSGIIGSLGYALLSNIKTIGAVDYAIYNLVIPTLMIVGVYMLLAKLLKFEEINDF
jgi:hypothetical protein